MMRKKFRTKLLAFLVAAVTVIPTTAFAADAVNQTAKQGLNPAVLFNQALEGGAIQTSEGQGTGAVLEQTPAKDEAATPADPAAPKDTVQQPEDSKTPADPVDSVKPEAPDTPVTPPVDVAPPANPTPVPETPGEPVPAPEAPAVPVPEEPAPAPVATAPAIIVEEATPAAIEAVPATLTITHRLTVGNQHLDDTQTIEGLEVGQTIDLTQYMDPADWEECLSQTTSITLDSAENTAILEYGVKADSGVIIVIDDKNDNPDGEM